MNTHLWPHLTQLVKQHVMPALGCTEPTSIALASATARLYLQAIPDKIEIMLSPNLFKNCMGVTVPGTGMTGSLIAAAVGSFGGDPHSGLEVLKSLSPKAIDDAKKMVADKKVTLHILDDNNKELFVEIRMTKGEDYVSVIIEDKHTNIVTIERNGEYIFQRKHTDLHCNKKDHHQELFVFNDVYEFATQVPFSEIEFILQAKDLNNRLSKEGLAGNYGLQIGRKLEKQQKMGLLDNGLLSEIAIRSSSASDARMGGALFPAMSNSGSGNQGIAATMPVVVVAEHMAPNDNEKLARALILSHLTAIYIHLKLPVLSAFCAVTTASMGAAAAIAWLISGRRDIAAKAVTNMIGDIAGIFCDGASNSCALKVSTSTSTAYKAVLLAMDDSVVSSTDGIITNDIDTTIANLGLVACNGMKQTDKIIIQTMYEKGRGDQNEQ